MRHETRLNSQNSSIEVVIKLNNKHYKLAIERGYSSPDKKIGTYLGHTCICGRSLRTNKQPNNSYKTMLIEMDLS